MITTEEQDAILRKRIDKIEDYNAKNNGIIDNLASYSPTWNEMSTYDKFEYYNSFRHSYPKLEPKEVVALMQQSLERPDKLLKERDIVHNTIKSIANIPASMIYPSDKNKRRIVSGLISGGLKDVLELPVLFPQFAFSVLGQRHTKLFDDISAISEGLTAREKSEIIGATVAGIGTSLLEVGAVAKLMKLGRAEKVFGRLSKVAGERIATK